MNTANTIFALLALVVLGSPRSGVLLAVERTQAPLDVPLLLAATAVAACVGCLLMPALGDHYLALAGRLDYKRVSVGMLVLLAAVSFRFAGTTGVAVFLVAGSFGLVPARVAVKRVHLMGR